MIANRGRDGTAAANRGARSTTAAARVILRALAKDPDQLGWEALDPSVAWNSPQDDVGGWGAWRERIGVRVGSKQCGPDGRSGPRLAQIDRMRLTVRGAEGQASW